ncbi:MAG: tRNA (adenosine(37)-N6)-dimethylallyltransferase MiaA, partial [Firmicutes bacterium]|nr:tRNA (adenosine(37)-N6)-dimethylallyltransferase MiaA [Bacillota bacterium]
MKQKVLFIVGPTAVGKTKYAIAAARALDGEIVSADSMQIYQRMDIGSAKPTPEEQAQAVHHLVDFLPPQQQFSVAEYQPLAKAAISDILNRGKLPVVSGGTGLYVNSLIYQMDFGVQGADESLRRALEKEAAEKGAEALHARLREKDPEAAERIHPNNVQKIVRALEVLETTDTDVICTVVSGGKVSNRKGVNIPGTSLELEYISEADRNDILFGIEMDVDYIAASFVRNGNDVSALRTLLNENGGQNIKIISKIENMEGIENFKEILHLSDGI